METMSSLLLRAEFCLSRREKVVQKNKQKRPRSRTLTALHNEILEDLISPSEIMGKRICVKLDAAGS